MRRLMLLAYYFPPLGGAGAQRPLKFAKYLPESGFQVSVVTGPGAHGTDWGPLDASLCEEIGGEGRIHRTGAGDPLLQLGPSRRGGRLRRLLGLRSRFAQAWIEGAFASGLRAAEQARPDVILATMSPFESCEPAARLARALGVPWVADLRDPWALDETMVYPSGWHRRLELRRMRQGLASAALIVMNTPEAELAIRTELPELARHAFATVPNGFDAADFAGPEPIRGERFRIVHAGRLHLDTALAEGTRRRQRLLGGPRVPVDMRSRSHYYLVQALARWVQEQPEIRDQVECVLVGPYSQRDVEIVQHSGIAPMVQFTSYLSHARSVESLRSADLLFLPMHDLPRGERARIVPGKTYEYLASGVPILAAVPPGDARDWLAESGRAELCAPSDVPGMVAALQRHFGEKRPLRRVDPCQDPFVRRFDRRQLTGTLARLLDGVIEHHARPAAAH